MEPGKVVYAVYPQGLVVALKALEARDVEVGELKAKAETLEAVFWKGYKAIVQKMTDSEVLKDN